MTTQFCAINRVRIAASFLLWGCTSLLFIGPSPNCGMESSTALKLIISCTCGLDSQTSQCKQATTRMLGKWIAFSFFFFFWLLPLIFHNTICCFCYISFGSLSDGLLALCFPRFLWPAQTSCVRKSIVDELASQPAES